MEELASILSRFGVTALWGVVLYKLLDFIEVIGILSLIGYGIKKAWPSIKAFFIDF